MKLENDSNSMVIGKSPKKVMIMDRPGSGKSTGIGNIKGLFPNFQKYCLPSIA